MSLLHILVVEDTVEEQEKARQAIEAAGHTCTIVSSLRYDEETGLVDAVTDEAMQNADAVITDLHFFPDSYVMRSRKGADDERMKYGLFFDPEKGQLPPCGLLVVIDALVAGKPVVICTAGDHHGPAMSWIYDRYLRLLHRTQAFGWNDRKDWIEAVKQLEERCNS